jgi:hypothetical protein
MKASLPRDDNSTAIPIVPAIPALAVTNSTALSSQLEVTLNAATSIVEISALNTGIFMKYKTVAGGTAVSASVFDEFIQPGTTRHYKIPVGITVLAFLQYAATATMMLIEK